MKNYKKYKKQSDKFWKENLMKILDCMFYEEATWASDSWQKYGISKADQKHIEMAFWNYKHQKSKPEKTLQQTI